jgi:hypothetical protein
MRTEETMPDSANEHLAWLEARFKMDPPASVLDVGMGRGSYGWFLRNTCGYEGKLYGLEIWSPYVVGPDAISGGNRTYYDEIVVKDVRHADDVVTQLFPDVVFAFDVIEHMVKKEGMEVIRMLQRRSKRAVLVSVPILPYPQGPVHGNPHEEHKHDWDVEQMLSLGCELRSRGAATGLFEFPPGRVDKKVSVMLNTARGDESFRGRSVLGSIAERLDEQAFPYEDMEFVIADGLFHERHEQFALHDKAYRVIHVPPKDTAMVREGRCAISAYKNTAIAHARGELLLTIDDGCTFDNLFLERVWEAWAQKRECLSALYQGVDDDGAALASESNKDSRRIYLGADGRCVGKKGGDPRTPPGQGFTAFPLEAALNVNGYDEMFDGSRGLEDTDFGMRLQLAGYFIALDRRHTVGIYQQGPWSKKIFKQIDDDMDSSIVKCSQTTLRVRMDRVLRGEFLRANRTPWTPAEWGKVAPRCVHLGGEAGACCTLFPPGQKCPYVGLCSDREHPGLAALLREPPTFELAEARRESGAG